MAVSWGIRAGHSGYADYCRNLGGTWYPESRARRNAPRSGSHSHVQLPTNQWPGAGAARDHTQTGTGTVVALDQAGEGSGVSV